MRRRHALDAAQSGVVAPSAAGGAPWGPSAPTPSRRAPGPGPPRGLARCSNVASDDPGDDADDPGADDRSERDDRQRHHEDLVTADDTEHGHECATGRAAAPAATQGVRNHRCSHFPAPPEMLIMSSWTFDRRDGAPGPRCSPVSRPAHAPDVPPRRTAPPRCHRHHRHAAHRAVPVRGRSHPRAPRAARTSRSTVHRSTPGRRHGDAARTPADDSCAGSTSPDAPRRCWV